MKRPARRAIAVALLVLAAWIRPGAVLAQPGDSQTPAEATPVPSALAGSSFPWPHQFSEAGQAFTVYPPQLNKWQGERLEGQAAVAVQPAGADKPVFGVVWLSARTELDAASGMVKVRDISASRASFPTAPAQAGGYLDAIRAHLAAMSWSIARERLESDLAIEHASREVQNEPLRNIAPRILYSETPAILVPIDGAPQLKEMSGLGLMRVINTRALILQDKTTGRYFLYVAGHWMQASAIEGPWSEAQVRPSALDEAKQQVVASGQVELVEDSEAPSARAPTVYVSTGPAELVQTDGPPQYLPIQGTNLLYVTNTPNRLFLDLQTQRYYLLLSGRWYRTASLTQGNWEFVPGTSLPADFAMIPDNHPSEGVRASVPGTPQAQEAVIANGVPQVAAVKRTAATLEITYDGSPQFRPIEGTPLQYAVNAPIPVIEVDPNSFYALDNGVWFAANSPFGAWSTATWVPPVIYSIPRSSPLHYVTYVRVYEATPEVVYEGYYPGYVGSYVAPGATVVYGTGWYYQPWIGTVWYGAPVTWGFGFSFYSSWWGPWPYTPWFWAGWAPYPFFRPWWGPWCAPVAIAPAFVPHRVFVGNGVAPVGVGRVTVNNIHANTVNVTNIFNRWGNRVATPLGPRATFASGNGMRPTRAGAMQATRGGAAMASRGPGNESMAFAGGGAPHSSVTGAGGAGGNPNVQGFRRSGGQWQSFAGNGQWRNVNAPNLNSQSPPIGQSGGTRPGAIGGAPFGSGAPGGGPRPGTIGGAPVVSGAPTHGWSGPSAGQPTSPSGSQFATGTQNNRWSGSPATRSMAPQFGAGAQNNRWSGGPPTVRSLGPSGSGRSFGAPAGVHFGQGGGVEVAPMGRSGGAWAPAHGGAAANMAGGNAAGGRPAIGGGGGHGWGGAGGGGRMGGSMR